MFCKWCGKKINDNGAPCPHCGREQSPLENGNGFWDLCKSGSAPGVSVDIKAFEDSQRASINRGEHSVHNDGNTKRKSRNVVPFVVASAALTLVALIAVIICLGKVAQCIKDVASLHNSITEMQSTQSSGIEELWGYLEEEFAQLEDNNTTDHSRTETSGIEDPADVIQNDEWWTNASFDSTEDFSIQRYQIKAKSGMWLYTIEGTDNKRSQLSICWQMSADMGITWDVIAENTAYILVKNSNVMYRAVIKSTEERILNLDSDIAELDSLPVTVSVDAVSDSLILYRLTNIDGTVYEWQYSDDGNNWHLFNQNVSCLIDLNNKDTLYRLLLNTDTYYCINFENTTENEDLATDED